MNLSITHLRFHRKVPLLPALLVLALLLSACGSSEEVGSTTAAATADTTQAEATGTSDDATAASAPAAATDATTAEGVDVSLFFDGALEDVTTEDCALSGGVETTCYRITAAGYPVSYETGPFCPTTITDETGGLWWDGEAVYDLDGEFIASLAEVYGDDGWQMFDEDGNVFITETAEEFEAAARPDVDPSLQNHCVEGQLEWLEDGEPIPTTVLIPTTPVAADSAAAPQGNQGVTLDGVVIAASAPVDAILGAYTIAAFDDCGAHFNPFEGYHLHGAVGCSEVEGDAGDGETVDGETPQFGYAMDGYPIHSPLEDESDLDACNGHTTEADGYHYHANDAAENQVVECLVGQTVAGADDAAGGPPAGGGGDRPEGPPPGQG